MKRRRHLLGMFAWIALGTCQSSATAQTVWLSLNLDFNVTGDFNSGGTWTTVAKADAEGLAGVSMFLANTATFTEFLAPPELDVRVQGLFGAVRNVVVGDELTPPYPLGIGVIGSSFPSSYIDPPQLASIGGYADLGSFTGGVALATGTFVPGVVPDWTSFNGSLTDANVFSGPSPAPVLNADTVLTVLTVRYAVAPIPEPAALSLAAFGMAGAIVLAGRSRRPRPEVTAACKLSYGG